MSVFPHHLLMLALHEVGCSHSQIKAPHTQTMVPVYRKVIKWTHWADNLPKLPFKCFIGWGYGLWDCASWQFLGQGSLQNYSGPTVVEGKMQAMIICWNLLQTLKEKSNVFDALMCAYMIVSCFMLNVLILLESWSLCKNRNCHQFNERQCATNIIAKNLESVRISLHW